MKITLTPMRRDAEMALSVNGNIVSINDETYDFSELPEGALLPRNAIFGEFFAGDVERIGGELHLTLVLPHGAQAPQETLFPVEITISEDGPVALPPYEMEAK